jgi:hypothetical protein
MIGSMEDDEMAGRTVDLQLDAVVRIEDWPALAAACVAAERELVEWGPEGRKGCSRIQSGV